MKHVFLITLFAVSGRLFGQTGGTTGFNFLNLSYNARAGALGGDFITVRDQDLNLGLLNPALLNASMDGIGSINQGLLAGGISVGSLNYAKQFKQDITGSAHLRYVAYGKMNRTDVNGTAIGSFSPGDFILGASAAKSINERMFIGATFNIIYSQMDQYIAFGNSIDVGGCYTDEDKNLVVSGVVKNLGIAWKDYHGSRDMLPLELQLGVSHKLHHAPFRFSIVGQQLQKWDLTYNDPNAKEKTDPLTGEIIPIEKANFAEKLARHFIFQTEILFGKKLHLRAALNYQRRQELKLTQRPGIAGFSFGAGLYFKRFTLDYGLICFSSAGFQNMLSISVPLSGKK